MEKGKSGIWTVHAVYVSTTGGGTIGAGVTGDAGNITAKLYQSGATSGNDTTDTYPSEVAAGYYNFVITSSESNTTHMLLVPDSSTATVEVRAIPSAIYPRPADFDQLVEISQDIQAIVNELPDAGALTSLPASFVSELESYTSTAPGTISVNVYSIQEVAQTGYDLIDLDTNIDLIAADITTVKGHTSKIGTPINATVSDDINVVSLTLTSIEGSVQNTEALAESINNITSAIPDSGTLSTITYAVGTDIPALIDDLPTVSEFEERSLPSADYVVVGDTIAGVTTATNLTNAPTNGDLTAAMKASVTAAVPTTTQIADGVMDEVLTDLSDNALNSGESITPRKAIRALFNRFFRLVTQTASAQVVHNDSDAQIASMATSDDGTTQTKGKAT